MSCLYILCPYKIIIVPGSTILISCFPDQKVAGVFKPVRPWWTIRKHLCGITPLLLLVTSSDLMLKDNFVIYLMQGGEIFGTIPEWAQFSQGCWRETFDPTIPLKILFHYSSNFPSMQFYNLSQYLFHQNEA